MSMNLNCKQADLRQTPTYITYCIFSNGDGGWQGILYRYEQWTLFERNNTLNSSYYRSATEEERQKVISAQEEHIKQLKMIAHQTGGLDFYVM